jgi:hypothetical protein
MIANEFGHKPNEKWMNGFLSDDHNHIRWGLSALILKNCTILYPHRTQVEKFQRSLARGKTSEHL